MYCGGNPVIYRDPTGHKWKKDRAFQYRKNQSMYGDAYKWAAITGGSDKKPPAPTWIPSGDEKDEFSSLVSMIPVVGDSKDWAEAFSGKDAMTGRTLAKWERGLTVGAALLPVVGGAAARRYAKKVATSIADKFNLVKNKFGFGKKLLVFTDKSGNILDLNKFKKLEKIETPIKVNRSGSNIPLKGKANSFVSTTGGHKIVYDASGNALYDISKKRIKKFEWHKAPNGNIYPKRGEGTKIFKGQVPDQLLKLLE